MAKALLYNFENFGQEPGQKPWINRYIDWCFNGGLRLLLRILRIESEPEGEPALPVPTPMQRGFIQFVIWTLLVLPGLFLALLICLPLGLWGVWGIVKAAASSGWPLIAALFGCALVAYALFLIRKQFLFFYGVAEFVVGIFACWRAFLASPDPYITSFCLIATGLYLCVRALTNIEAGQAQAQIIIAAYMKVFRPPEPKEIEWPEKFEPL